MSALAIHLAGDCAPGCEVCEVEAADREGVRCDACGGGFTASEWADRCGHLVEVHADCCTDEGCGVAA